MTDTSTTGETVNVHENSILSWFVDDIESKPFEGRSAIIDIAKMILDAHQGQSEDDSFRTFVPVVERELLSPEFINFPRERARTFDWEPEFDRFDRTVANAKFFAVELARDLGTALYDAQGNPAPIGAQLIGSTLYDTCEDFWMPIPENSLGSNCRAILRVRPEDLMTPASFEVLVAFDSADDRPAIDARNSANYIHEKLVEMILEKNPYAGTAHTVSVSRGGLVPVEVLELSRETRDTLYLEDSVWAEMDDQFKIFGELGDQLESANIRTSRGVLLQGWPGCGKTKMIRVYANELSNKGITVIVANSAAARHVSAVIEYAKTFDKAVVVLEDIDSVVGPRGASALSEFLNALDGVSQQNRIVTVATTNDGTALDPAAVRPGRIDAVIDVSTLNEQAITSLLAGMSAAAGYTIDAARVADAVCSRSTTVTGAMLEGLILNALLKHDRLETETLERYVREDWRLGDPRKNFLGVYDDERGGEVPTTGRGSF